MGRPFTSKADGPISDGPIGEVKSNYGLGTIGGYGSGLSISSGLMETIPASFSNDTSDKKMSNGASNGATSGSNSSWTSIFGLSSRNPLPLPPAPISIGDKIVVVPPDEVIAQEVGVAIYASQEMDSSLRGVDFIAPVTNEWKPRKCNSCHALGHSVEKCPTTVERKLQQKEVMSKIIPDGKTRHAQLIKESRIYPKCI
ncbi:uncharacterized protein E5676_scaffold506G00610 [Cucumis melo var. makuwa]|uniref:Zinc knuckle CX2CX4HX4C n=1 Tax=Cucumis melo var. makuwa TaxID=1194695 RepID=A0A5A7TAI5_CUCMM|nr:uncharacterized protein E6C27_scaffold270G002720 [Cucumis melo var. makuwa]TYJ97009.1 uncharacterized protein E5676_scaffold506G00610 [Cucumis melo var. makuwa]